MIALAIGSASPVAAAGDAPAVSAGQPAGFDALLQTQETVADVYVAGVLAGTARVRYAPGRVTLLDVDAVMGLLPDLIDPATVRAALAAPDLDPHAAMVCHGEGEGAPACPILRPPVAGVIFDEARFRLDVVVASRLRAIRPAAARAYLPRPVAGPSLVDRFGGTIAGNGGHARYAFQNRAILARGEGRIRNDLSYSSTYGLSVDALVAELDRPGLRYAAGAMWVPGIDLIGRRRVVGVGVQSQVDTRLDRAVIAGSPLIVSLATRARVDILRDGLLLTSRTYDAGNQTLDTATLPDGAYEVVLHIQEAAGSGRDERRFFTKNTAIAAAGEPIFFANVGLLGEDRRGSALATSRTPFYQAGIARRFTPRLALDATVMGTDRTALLELGGYWLSRAAQLRGAVLGSVRGDAGLLFQATSSGEERLTYAIDARRVWSRDGRPLIPLGLDGRRSYDVVSIDRTAALSAGSFAQVSATIGYRLRQGQIGVTTSYRRDPRAGRNYAIGPSVTWPLIERAGVQVTLRGDVTLSNSGTAGFLGLAFQRLHARSALTAAAGVRSIAGTGSGNGTAVVGAVGAAWQRDHVLGGDASLAAGVEREVNGTLVRGRVDLRAAPGSFYADVAQPIAGANGATQYSLSFQTTAAVTPDRVALQGREQQDSVIAVAVEGAARGTQFEVLVDNTPRGIVRSGATLSVPVPAYRQYAVRLRSLGADIMKFDGGARTVGVYPGNVARVTWSARRVLALFGRIVWPNGAPVAQAAVFVPGAIGSTDADGWFQIEAGAGETLSVQAADGRRCRLPLRPPAGAHEYAALGTMTCSPPLPVVRMAAAE